MNVPFNELSLVLLTVSMVGVAAVILSACFPSPSRDPHPVGWNSELCSHCGMVVADSRFAAQLETADGHILNFDTPGCLMLWVTRHHLPPRAIYFHPMQGDGWLTLDQSAFLLSLEAPGDCGLGIVRRGTPGAIGWEKAVELARQSQSSPYAADAPAELF